MKITHTEIVSIPVRDQIASRNFFVEKLGFTIVRDEPMGDARWIQVAPKGAQTTFSLVTWFENMRPGGLHGVMLVTDDVEAAHEQLHAAGVDTTPIEEQPWGRFIMFSDIDGNGFVLNQPPGGPG